jgi:hypothetical protein
MVGMAVAVKKLGLEIGDLVEIGGRCYDVVSDTVGGVTLSVYERAHQAASRPLPRPVTPQATGAERLELSTSAARCNSRARPNARAATRAAQEPWQGKCQR